MLVPNSNFLSLVTVARFEARAAQTRGRPVLWRDRLVVAPSQTDASRRETVEAGH
jgi:hypothetical protein